MKTKSRDYRKLERARRRYKKTLKETINKYTKELLFADLHLKSVARWFFNKYPKPLPKITYQYENL